MAKRANGEGSISQRTDGKWEARFSYIDSETGKVKRSSSYGDTRREAKAKMDAKRSRVELGQPVRDSSETVSAYAERWMTGTLALSPRKETTKETYRALVRAHVLGSALGAMTFERVKPSDVESWLAGLTTSSGRAVSESTRRQTYTVVRSMLDTAVRDGLAARNPASVVARPRVGRTEERFLTPSEMAALIESAREHSPRYAPIIELLGRTGLRRGEALALRWRDVDLEAETLRVAGTLSRVGGTLIVTEPKTAQSRRVLPIGPKVAALFRERRAAQEVERVSAESWHSSELVWTTDSGTPVEPRNVLRAVSVAAKRAGLDGVGVHTLRHSAASIMLGRGESLKAVSEQLGHSSVAITGDVYGFLAPDVKRSAAAALDGAF